MNSLARTIDQALDNIGRGPRDLLLETLTAFENLGLPDEERIAAIATAVASNAASRHNRHIPKFLDAVQTWALEAALGHSPALPRIFARPEAEAIAEGAELLTSGVEALVEALSGAQVPLQDRVIAELTVYTRLLGQHDPHTILLTLGSIAEALQAPEFRPGDLVSVPLRDPAPSGREIDLATVSARGVA